MTGHTRVPHTVYDLLLIEELTKRELLVLLLVARLTYVCRREWVVLRQADLKAIGIGANHARETLGQLRGRNCWFVTTALLPGRWGYTGSRS
jgi:hypothetical protein